MKITKFPQSCLMVESGGVRLLFDPGALKYRDEYFDIWDSADAVFITHKHPDHCYAEKIAKFRNSLPVYTTAEAAAAYPELSRAVRIAEGDKIAVGGISVTAVKAVHGYHPMMKGNEVYENVGFVADDGAVCLYITGDTICFPTDIKANALAMPVTGHGVTMTAFEASLFAKETGAKTILLTHMDNEAFEVDYAYIDKHFGKAGLEYIVPDSGWSLEIS